MFRRESPVARFVVLTLLLLALVLSAAVGAFNHLTERARLRAELRTATQVQADQLAASLALPTWNFDQPQIEKIAESVLHDREALGISVQVADRSSPDGARPWVTWSRKRRTRPPTRPSSDRIGPPTPCPPRPPAAGR